MRKSTRYSDRFSDEQLLSFLELRDFGINPTQIAKNLGIQRDYVREALREIDNEYEASERQK